ncbi:hypothetical protein EDD22DRAFT_917215, partial [Suillus occidentalis]
MKPALKLCSYSRLCIGMLVQCHSCFVGVQDSVHNVHIHMRFSLKSPSQGATHTSHSQALNYHNSYHAGYHQSPQVWCTVSRDAKVSRAVSRDAKVSCALETLRFRAPSLQTPSSGDTSKPHTEIIIPSLLEHLARLKRTRRSSDVESLEIEEDSSSESSDESEDEYIPPHKLQ